MSCCSECEERARRRAAAGRALARRIAARHELGAAGDPLIWTPGAVREELTRARRTLDAVNADVSRAAGERRITGDEWNQWRDFYVTSHRYVTSASAWTGASVARARTIISEASRWRALVASRGTRPSGVAPEQPRDAAAPAWLRWAAGAAIAVALAPVAAAVISRVPRRNHLGCCP